MNGKGIGLLLAGFTVGLLVSRLPRAAAAINTVNTDLSKREFLVSIDEIRQNFAFGEPFVGHYYKTVTLSDGKTRRIELTPMIHHGVQVVEFRDNRGLSYMGLNGTTTDGTLMVQVRDVNTMQAEAQADGYPFPAASAGKYPIPILPALPIRVMFERVRGAEAEAMMITNETTQPMDLFIAVFHSGKYVGARNVSVPAQTSSNVEASQGWKKSSAPSDNRPGQGPQPGDQVRVIDMPNQAGSHEAKYQEWRSTVP